MAKLNHKYNSFQPSQETLHWSWDPEHPAQSQRPLEPRSSRHQLQASQLLRPPVRHWPAALRLVRAHQAGRVWLLQQQEPRSVRWSTSCYNHNDNNNDNHNNDNHSYFEAHPNSTTDSDRRSDCIGASAVCLSNNSVSLLQQRPGKVQTYSLACKSKPQFGSKGESWAMTGMLNKHESDSQGTYFN